MPIVEGLQDKILYRAKTLWKTHTAFPGALQLPPQSGPFLSKCLLHGSHGCIYKRQTLAQPDINGLMHKLLHETMACVARESRLNDHNGSLYP